MALTNVVIRIGAQAAQAVSEIGKVNHALGEQMTSADKAGSAIKKAAVPAAIAFAAVSAAAISAVKSAASYEAAQSKLAAQLTRTTGATDEQVKSAQSYVSQLSKSTAIAGSELRPALAKLALATGDLTKAQTGLQVATDLSVASGKDMSAASNALAKAYAGQGLALTRMLPGFDKAIAKSGDFTKINAELARVTGGAATEAAQTQEGQMRSLALQTEALKRSMGESLLPAMQAVTDVMTVAVGVALEHQGALKVLIGAVAALSGGILLANAALKAYAAVQTAVKVATAAWSAAQWLLNAALTANPIGLVIVAVAALAAGLVIAYKKSETFRAIVGAAFDAVKVAVDALASAFRAVMAAASAAFSWIKDHWKVAAFALGPLGVAIVAIASNFDAVKAAGVGAFNAISAAIQSLIGWIKSAMDWVGNLVGKIGSIHMPSIPGLNVALAPMTYTPAGVAGYVRAAPSAAGGGAVTINVYGAIDPEGTARSIDRVMRAHYARQGRRRQNA